MSGQIFISYRHEESSGWTGRLFDHLSRHFPSNQIFMDVDSVDLGEDFVEKIEKTVGSCDVLIAVIGKSWLTSCDQEGQRRLENPEDFVRIEIATALKRGIRVVPVLVDGASVPLASDLPDDLKALIRRNALQLGLDRFRTDSERLIAAVERALEKAAGERRETEAKAKPEATQPSVEIPKGKSPSKQVIAFLAIAAVLVIGGLIYLASRSSKSPPPQPALVPALIPSTKDHPWVNSLGMKFVPVAGTQVLFSIWDTRVEDFEAFVKNTGYDATARMQSLGKDSWQQRGATWKDPGFKQGPTDPVVGVSWYDAKTFCEWLTKRERGSGALPEGVYYRLPTDEEWSIAVGLDSERGNTPEEKDSKIQLYPWGTQWPPPPGAGNYAGEEWRIGNEPEDWGTGIQKGYNDGYPRTSPVGSFAANKNGLYDMGGNVWQWCEDWYNSLYEERVVRGGSWIDGLASNMYSSSRAYRHAPDVRYDMIGFRCVVAPESSQ